MFQVTDTPLDLGYNLSKYSLRDPFFSASHMKNHGVT